jgi:hypothetical protein
MKPDWQGCEQPNSQRVIYVDLLFLTENEEVLAKLNRCATLGVNLLELEPVSS